MNETVDDLLEEHHLGSQNGNGTWKSVICLENLGNVNVAHLFLLELDGSSRRGFRTAADML